MAFFVQITAIFAKVKSIGFKEKRHFSKLANSTENCDHIIDPT
jgi:hypothetical protein